MVFLEGWAVSQKEANMVWLLAYACLKLQPDSAGRSQTLSWALKNRFDGQEKGSENRI